VGLGYLHLNRITATLSAGESQRIKLAGLLGGGLTSLTVLLDEPTRGLHPAEVEALRDVLLELRDEGNTVILVEHDLDMIRAADHLLDLGPGAGRAGGEIVAQGRPSRVAQSNGPTAGWLRGDRLFDPGERRRQADEWLAIRGARANNLKDLDLTLPLRVFVGVCGVSGSGKSTLLIDTLGRALAPQKHTTSVAQEPLDPGAHKAIKGAPKRTILVDQSKAGVVSPAAFLALNGPFKKLYAASEDARALGLDAKSLARSCSSCKGRGAIKMDMGFLPAVRIICEVRLRGVTLPELDALTIDEVYDLFSDWPEVARKLAAARDVGLGYLVLRQPGYALSGGEAQRLKIAKELCRKTPSSTLYILDEPTVGQHLEDVMRLICVLQKLVEAGHSVIVVEHHVHLLAACDWLVELGPGGGPDGGHIIAAGTPEAVADGHTPTAPYLKQLFKEAGA
jgi:excinuclease ABC subunit A